MENYQNLDDIPIELAEAIRAVWRQAEAFAASGDPTSSGLMPKKTGDLQRDLSTYNERFVRLQMKLEKIIPTALKTLRSIDPKVQPRFYQYTVTLFLDILKYDIRDATSKSALRRKLERSWKRLRGAFLKANDKPF
jgi:hypothetical protein